MCVYMCLTSSIGGVKVEEHVYVHITPQVTEKPQGKYMYIAIVYLYVLCEFTSTNMCVLLMMA